MIRHLNFLVSFKFFELHDSSLCIFAWLGDEWWILNKRKAFSFELLRENSNNFRIGYDFSLKYSVRRLSDHLINYEFHTSKKTSCILTIWRIVNKQPSVCLCCCTVPVLTANYWSFNYITVDYKYLVSSEAFVC